MDLNSLKPTSPDPRATFRGGPGGKKELLPTGSVQFSAYVLNADLYFPIEIVEVVWGLGESANQLHLLGNP
jgi:hypothetical protein